MSSYSSLSRVLSPFRVQTKFEENSLPARSNAVSIRYREIMVFCIVLGDNTQTAFPVELPSDKKVGELRESIRKINPISFTNIDAKDLILWQVSISDEDVERMNILNTKPPSDINIEELGGKVMSSRKEINFYFPEDPVDEHIHIIIVRPQSPTTTGKRKAENFYNRSKREKREYPKETSEGRDSLMVISADRKETFINYMEKNRIGLLRSPPSTGKSTIGEYLRDCCDGIGIYISLAGIYDERESTIRREKFDTFWKNKLGCTWEDISNCTEKTYLFVDEVQFIYGNHAQYFWEKVKDLQSNDGCNENLCILFLGTYHPTLADNPTPIEIINTLGLNDLLLTRSEFDQLVTNIVQNYNDRSYFNIPDDARDVIFNITNGHPGLCRFIMRWLCDHYHEGTKSTSTTEILKSLASSSLRSSIVSTSRAFYWTDGWNPNEEEAYFIRNLLFISRDNNFHPIDLNSNSGIAKKFIRFGIIAMDSTNGRMKFSAPITRIILSHHLFTSPLAKSPTTNFEDFLTRTIERFCPTKLINSKGKGKGTNSYLFERTWQMEWYRSATTVVPIDATVSADVGPVFNSKGFLDFYVNGNYSWGIELLREGDNLQEHANRFLTNGIYSGIPLNQWAVLDFRCNSKEVRDPKQNFWYVCYSDDYKSFTIKRRGQADEILLLQGDNI